MLKEKERLVILFKIERTELLSTLYGMRWLSLGKVLTRLFRIARWVDNFFTDENSSFSEFVQDRETLLLYTYLSANFYFRVARIRVIKVKNTNYLFTQCFYFVFRLRFQKFNFGTYTLYINKTIFSKLFYNY